MSTDITSVASPEAAVSAEAPLERDIAAPSNPSTGNLQQPDPPSSQPLPLPPVSGNAAVPSTTGAMTQQSEGVGLIGMAGGGSGTVGPNNRATSFVAKRRLGGVPPSYGGLSSGPTTAVSTASPLNHLHSVQVPNPSPLNNGPNNVNGPAPSPAGAGGGNTAYPALHLHPLNDTFVPKQIWLSPAGTRVKIGRQTNLKTVPNASNGYFDSKVLSRMHAEVWTEDGRIWIKDVKSSNGTFINGERLSPEGVESEAFELHTDDIVEFGIDIVSDDNKTIVHHKVAAKVFLVLSAEDVAASSREFASYYRESPLHRRPSRAGPFAGAGFDHVLSRLQSELEKSRATGNELGNLNTAMSDIQDTLSGGAGPPPPLPPPYQPGNRPRDGGFPPHGQQGRDAHAQTLAAVQSQLAETQASLAAHMDKIRSLEGLLAEHEVIKREVGALRSQMEESKREVDGLVRGRGGAATPAGEADRGGRVSPVAAILEAREAEDDEDDNRSISSLDTVTLDSDLRASPKKPLPNGVSHAMPERASSTSPPPEGQGDARHLAEQNQALTTRLESISTELDEATKLGQTLRSQHAEAASTIRALEDRVQGLEKEVEGRVAKGWEQAQSRFVDWKKELEEGWRKQREGWEAEREKLIAVIQDWEERTGGSSGSDDEKVDSGIGSSGAGGAVAARGARGKRQRPRRKRKAPEAGAGGSQELTSTEAGGQALRGKASKPSRLAQLPMDELASDSDSTAIVGSGSMDDLSGKAGESAGAGAGGGKVPMITNNSLPFISAAAGVLVLGIAWTVANKSYVPHDLFLAPSVVCRSLVDWLARCVSGDPEAWRRWTWFC